jgi:predicted amidophosphoribosyltransferase
MPTVAELSDPYANFLLGPRPGPGVCQVCFDFTDGHRACWSCTHLPRHLDAVMPISYSVAHEQLHHVLAAYKRAPQPVAGRLQHELAAILWRHLSRHETCLAAIAGATRFDLVTTVPSGHRDRAHTHPLPRIVGDLIGPTRARHRHLLRRSSTPVEPRTVDPDKYEPTTRLSGESVLLIDDTWTTGASAQSAAAALNAAGSGPVAALVIGRHVNREWGSNDAHIKTMSTRFDWCTCSACIPESSATGAATVSG